MGQEAVSSPGLRSGIKAGLAHIHSSALECHTQHNSTRETQGLSRQLPESFPQEKAGIEKLARVNQAIQCCVSAYHSHFFSLQGKLQCKNLKAMHNCTFCKMSPQEIKLSS